ncbi:kinase-like protein [Leptomonas seymouri]|uniref:Kinase-like protein n=1 Tax=Leptomonas seymouri TaxID=5684 RepID=A0A0N1ILF4_LEPSE|nr:kinase-like protein [Leptomonas seymouri]|eukprot:KPI88168.1 kinase-like protein [Leptomonas seymouri]
MATKTTKSEVAMDACRDLIAAAVHEAGIPSHDRSGNMPGYFGTFQCLGRGSFGYVELVYRYSGRGRWRRVAIKTIFLDQFSSLEAALLMAREVGQEVTLSRCGTGSPHVITIDRAWFSLRTNRVHLEMEAGDEDLKTYTQTRHRIILPPFFLLSICVQCAMAVEHVHRAGVVHRDVKPRNFVVNVAPCNAQPPLVRLTDFGLSAAVSDARVTHPNIGSMAFMAPEASVTGGGKLLPTARDVWSLGVTFYCLATGMSPTYHHVNDAVRIGMPVCDCFQQSLTPESQALVHVAAWMLHPDYMARPKMDEVLRRLYSLGCTPAALSPSAVPLLRRMRVCRPDGCLPIYERPKADAKYLTEFVLPPGSTFFVCGELRTCDPPSTGRPMRHSLPAIEPETDHNSQCAAPCPHRARNRCSVLLEVTTWLCVVYPCHGYCRPFVKGQHAVHYVKSGESDAEAFLRCPPVKPLQVYTSSEGADAASLVWEEANMLRAPLVELSPPIEEPFGLCVGAPL